MSKNDFDHVQLSEIQQRELDWMKAHPNTGGTIGWELKDGFEAVDWHRYFTTTGQPKRAQFMMERFREKKTYMVAARWPQWVHRDYTPAKEPTKTRLIPLESD